MVGKAERTFECVHTPLLTPLLHGINEGATHFYIVNKVYPTEAHGLFVPLFIGPVVDNGGHAAYNLSFAIGQKVVGLTELESGIPLGRERVQHVVVEVGDGVFVFFIKLVVKANEAFQFRLGRNSFYFNGHRTENLRKECL